MSKTEYQQNAVSAATWPWVDEAGEEAAPAPRHTLGRAVVGAGIGYTVAALFYFVWQHAVPAILIVTVATCVLGMGAFLPKGFRRFEAGVAVFARGVGTALAWILLTPLYFLFFAPMHGFLRLSGKDPLDRKFPDERTSYWQVRDKDEDAAYFRRQF